MGLILIIALAVASWPPSAPGRRVVRGQEVEANPNWGRSFAAAARFGSGYGRGVAASPPPPKPKVPDLRARFLTNKFSANPWTFQVTPAHDLWLAQSFPLR